MKGILLAAAFLAAFALLAIGMLIGAQTIPEAPAGFDGLTNGSITQAALNVAAADFSEIRQPAPDGLGPVFNAVSCLDCHQSTRY